MDSVLLILAGVAGHVVGLLVDPFFWLTAAVLGIFGYGRNAGAAVVACLVYAVARVVVLPLLIYGQAAVRADAAVYVVVVAVALFALAALIGRIRQRLPRWTKGAGVALSGQENGVGGSVHRAPVDAPKGRP